MGPLVFSEAEISWFAGALDAEGSFGLRRHPTRKTQVLASAFFGMSDERTVLRAKRIAEELYGEPLTLHRRPPKGLSRAEFFSFTMVAKSSLFEFDRKIIPYLRIKRVEALLQYDFLSRASRRRHVGTEHDFWLCEMSRRLKDADPSAPEAVLSRVRDDFAINGADAAWLGGYTDGDGSISVATGTKTLHVSYGSMNKAELTRARETISSLLGGARLPQIAEDESDLSEQSQWRFDLLENTIVVPLLYLLRDQLFTKRAQADLALLVRETDDLATRHDAVALIHDLNHGRVAVDVANEFLRARSSTG